MVLESTSTDTSAEALFFGDEQINLVVEIHGRSGNACSR